MDSKKEKEQKVSERGKEIVKADKKEVVIPRRQPVKNINFTTRKDREDKENGNS